MKCQITLIFLYPIKLTLTAGLLFRLRMLWFFFLTRSQGEIKQQGYGLIHEGFLL